MFKKKKTEDDKKKLSAIFDRDFSKETIGQNIAGVINYLVDTHWKLHYQKNKIFSKRNIDSKGFKFEQQIFVFYLISRLISTYKLEENYKSSLLFDIFSYVFEDETKNSREYFKEVLIIVEFYNNAFKESPRNVASLFANRLALTDMEIKELYSNMDEFNFLNDKKINKFELNLLKCLKEWINNCVDILQLAHDKISSNKIFE